MRSDCLRNFWLIASRSFCSILKTRKGFKKLRPKLQNWRSSCIRKSAINRALWIHKLTILIYQFKRLWKYFEYSKKWFVKHIKKLAGSKTPRSKTNSSFKTPTWQIRSFCDTASYQKNLIKQCLIIICLNHKKCKMSFKEARYPKSLAKDCWNKCASRLEQMRAEMIARWKQAQE